MKFKNIATIAVAVIVLLTIVLAAYIGTPFKMSVISVSTLNIDQSGGLDGTNVRGTFWSIDLLLDTQTIASGYQFTFNDNQAHAYGTPYWQGKNVTIKNEIKVVVTPLQPYYERPMQLRSCEVVPKAYQNWGSLVTTDKDIGTSANALNSGHWETTTSDWILHTPFTVSIYVNGNLFGTKSIDSIGSSSSVNLAVGTDLKIGGASDYVTIQSLGAMPTSYSAPIWSSLVWWSSQYFFLNSEAVQNAIHNPYPIGDGLSPDVRKEMTHTSGATSTYAFYWYAMQTTGEVCWNYWSKDGTPYPARATSGSPPVSLDFNKVPGWADGGGGFNILWRLKPSISTPPLFPTSPKPSKSFNALSLIEYLQQITKAIRPSMPSWNPDYGSIPFGWNNSTNGYIRIYLPWGSFLPKARILISSDLADTIVWQPKVSNIKITSCPTDIGSVSDTYTVPITLQQTSTAASSGYVKLVGKSSDFISFSPPVFGTGVMQPSQQLQFSFTLTNLGEPSDTDTSFVVQVWNSNPIQGDQMTDSKTVKVRLLQRGTQVTILQVYVIDGDTLLYLSGIRVVVNYEQQSKEGFTSSGVATFEFGSASPYVTVTTVPDVNYKNATSQSMQLSKGPNAITLKLYKGAVPPPFPWIWIVLIVIVIVAVSIVVFATMRRRGGDIRW